MTERFVVLRDCSDFFKSMFRSIIIARAWCHEISFRGSCRQSGTASILAINSPAFFSMCLSTEQEAHTVAQRQKHNAVLSHALSNRENRKERTTGGNGNIQAPCYIASAPEKSSINTAGGERRKKEVLERREFGFSFPRVKNTSLLIPILTIMCDITVYRKIIILL